MIDYNRQSLDGVVSDRLFPDRSFFATVGWNVVHAEIRQAAAKQLSPSRAARRSRHWIDSVPERSLFRAHFEGGAGCREHRCAISEDDRYQGAARRHDDDALHRLMTNLGGHDLATRGRGFPRQRQRATDCFIAYTIKGIGLPFAGHKDNHAGLMTEQMEPISESAGHPVGRGMGDICGAWSCRDGFAAFLSGDGLSQSRAARESAHATPLAMPAYAAPASRRTDLDAGRLWPFAAELAKSDSRSHSAS